jgi:hypothetical protein
MDKERDEGRDEGTREPEGREPEGRMIPGRENGG